MTTGRRWYLLAYDRDREDWRSLRLDRMSDVFARGTTFTVRDAPDAATYISRSISSSPYRYIAHVRYHASAQDVAQHISPTSATIEPEGPNSCMVTAGADDPQTLALYLSMVGCDFETMGPPEIAGAASMGERLLNAPGAGK
ncbi:hypothetical protein BH09ACT8_BH09ACT8_67120 [soil metagenome]